MHKKSTSVKVRNMNIVKGKVHRRETRLLYRKGEQGKVTTVEKGCVSSFRRHRPHKNKTS